MSSGSGVLSSWILSRKVLDGHWNGIEACETRVVSARLTVEVVRSAQTVKGRQSKGLSLCKRESLYLPLASVM